MEFCVAEECAVGIRRDGVRVGAGSRMEVRLGRGSRTREPGLWKSEQADVMRASQEAP